MGDGYWIPLTQKTQFYTIIHGDAMVICYTILSADIYLYLYL